jgi:outer membrane biosynthesis protein TonB
MNSFVITTRITRSETEGETSRSLLWNTRDPIALEQGHPFRWVMEKTARGIRIRELGGNSTQMREILDANVGDGLKVELPKRKNRTLTLEIKPVRPLALSFRAHEVQANQTLLAFHCYGDWIASSTRLEDLYQAQTGDHVAFEIASTGGRYLIKASGETLKISGKEIEKGQTLTLGAEELIKARIQLSGTARGAGAQSWRFAALKAPEFTDTSHGAQTEDAVWFKKSLRYAAIGLGAFAIMTWLWPKPNAETEPLVPPQFAKIVMVHQPQSASSAAAKTETMTSKDLPKKVENAAVVQAFRAKALQSAVSGLLKGGMTQLLAQSDFVAGTARSQDAQKIFTTKSVAMNSTGAATGVSDNKNIAIASIGGEAQKGSAGYTAGEHASVKGQGHSFVSMDVADSTVEEGLTKDEVGEVIHRHMSEVRYCYESAMLRQPDIEGKLTIDFVIGGPGSVKSSEVKSSTLPDPRLDDCILRRLATWKFPQTKGGVDVAVSYPFIFKTLGR